MRPEIVCLLTGCIKPRSDLPFTYLKNPEIRKEQYVNAIRYQLDHYKYPLVFAENSEYDLSPVFEKEIRAGRIEMITFNGNSYPAQLGKGVGEYNCVNYALKHSRFIHENSFVFKITGRYQIQNLERFITQAQRIHDLYLFTDTDFSRKFSDSRCFGFKPAFATDYLKSCIDQLDEYKGVYFEHIMFRALLSAMSDGNVIDLFNGALRIIGVAGSMNQPYLSGSVRHIIRDIKKRFKYWHFHHNLKYLQQQNVGSKAGLY